MKKIFFTTLLLMVIVNGFTLESNKDQEWQKENPFSFPHWMTEEEKTRTDEIGRDFYETDPPVGPVVNIAEFNKMQGVLIRYPFGIPMALIAEMSQEIMVTTIVANQSQENTVTNQYNSNGVNIDNCNFIHAPSDSYWTRDYGPWFVIDGNYEVGIVNFPYNRPRPNDNDIPIAVADFLDINLFGMDLIHTGGNYMTDGMGISSSSDLVWDENPGLSHAEVDQLVEDYLGIETYYVVPDPNNTYIDHIDCWGKFLDVDKILIRSVPESHAQYDEIEATAEYYANQVSSYGNNYQVYRVYTPNNQPYTNSLILNDRVFVPITGSSWDDDALAVYEEAMPGYEILGFTGSWESTDALHCRTKGIADLGMLYIHHLPILGTAPSGIDYEIEAEIIPLSGANLVEDFTLLYYQVNNGDFIPVIMTLSAGNTYAGIIPSQPDGSEIGYYIQANDESGRVAAHPFMGPLDPHTFVVGEPIPPELNIDPTSFEVELSEGETTTEILELSNIGGGEINYTIEIDVPVNREDDRNISGSTIECSHDEFYSGDTVTWTFTVFNASTDDEWLDEIYIDFPPGVFVNSSTDFVGGTGDLVSDGAVGDGAEIRWYDPDGSWGNIHDGESASAEVDVNIDPDFVGDIDITYEISGDDYGSEPHTVYGNIGLLNAGELITWIDLETYSGTLGSGETDMINVYFDANDLEPGEHTCSLVVYDDRRNETVIPVTLTLGTGISDNDLENDTVLLGNYPNPFNSSTTISFNIIAEDGENAEISIYNVKGQKIRTLECINCVNAKASESLSHITWDGKDENNNPVSNGIYFYKLKSGKFNEMRKMILIH